MDWQAFELSIRLGLCTVAVLMPLGLLLGRWLAVMPRRHKPWLEAAVGLPLVLPPTVLGWYLLAALADDTWLARAWHTAVGGQLAFSFWAILLASVLVNLPFAVQPVQRALEALPPDTRQAAWLCGLSPWQTWWRVELPLAWPGVASAAALTFAHTLGEFGVVLMVGGAIPGQTKTLALALYDRAQALDATGARSMAAILLAVAVVTSAAVYRLAAHSGPRHD